MPAGVSPWLQVIAYDHAVETGRFSHDGVFHEFAGAELFR
jgi:hypothetical protein